MLQVFSRGVPPDCNSRCNLKRAWLATIADFVSLMAFILRITYSHTLSLLQSESICAVHGMPLSTVTPRYVGISIYSRKSSSCLLIPTNILFSCHLRRGRCYGNIITLRLSQLHGKLWRHTFQVVWDIFYLQHVV